MSRRGAKQAHGSQRNQSRSIHEVLEAARFAGKIEDGREADFRLANICIVRSHFQADFSKIVGFAATTWRPLTAVVCP